LGDALEAHYVALQTGGRAGILDIGRVEAAIGRLYTGYYRAITKKCAALAESLCCNHGFTDGNKRTCLLLLALLLDRSGYDLMPLPDEDIDRQLELLLVATASRAVDFAYIEHWFG
jgi:death-on-curing family protein